MLWLFSPGEVRPSSPFKRRAFSSATPINQVFQLLGVPMIVLSIPAGLINPLLGAWLTVGGAGVQLAGRLLDEKSEPHVAAEGARYLIEGPLWVVETLLRPLGVSLHDLVGLVAEGPSR